MEKREQIQDELDKHYDDYKRFNRKQKVGIMKCLKKTRREILKLERKQKQGNKKSIITQFKTGIPPLHSKVSDQKYLDTSDFDDVYWRSVPSRVAMTGRIEKYFTEPSMKWRTDAFAVKARELVRNELSLVRKAKVLSVVQGWRTLPRDTSPGLPLTRYAGNMKKRDCGEMTIAYCRKVIWLTRYGWGDYRFPPCVSAARLQLCKKPKNKPRLVWVYPMCVSIFESIFSVPITNAWKTNALFSWHVNWLRGAGPELASSVNKTDGATFGVDFSGFDTKPSTEAIDWAFSIIRENLNFHKPWHARLFHAVKYYFKNTPILMYNRLYLKKDKVPSGSGFTQLVDSLICAYLNADIVLRLHSTYNPRFELNEVKCLIDVTELMKILGDDSLVKLKGIGLRYNAGVEISEMFDTLHDMTAHPEKGFVLPTGAREEDEAVDFLGKQIWSERDFDIDKSLLKAQIYIPEDKDENPGDVMTRLVGLAWSCGTSWEKFDYLHSKWIEIKEKYPHVEPSPWKIDMRRYFRYVEDIKLPPPEFPTYGRILKRYTKASMPLPTYKSHGTTSSISSDDD